jgi:hypothetical protein
MIYLYVSLGLVIVIGLAYVFALDQMKQDSQDKKVKMYIEVYGKEKYKKLVFKSSLLVGILLPPVAWYSLIKKVIGGHKK